MLSRTGMTLRSLVLVVLAAACSSPPPVAKKAVVVAELDPSLPVPKLPLPNDLARDPDTGLIDVVDPADANDAELAFNAWLRSLDGFPVTSPITIPFSAALEPASLTASTVQVFDVSSGTPVPLTPKSMRWDEAKNRIVIEHPWRAGSSYAVAVVGGSDGARAVNGNPVVGSDAFELIRATYPLVTCSDLADATCRSANPAIKGKTLDDERKKALKMERARLAARPIIDAVTSAGISRDALASVFTFHTASEVLTAPVVNFNPAVRAIPFPSDALLRDGKVALPFEPGDDELITQTKAELGRLDGFSTTAAIVTEHNAVMGAVGVGLKASSLSASQLVLLDVDDSNAEVGFTLGLRASPDQILLTPQKPLKSHHRHAVIWKKGAETLDGVALKPSAAWAMVTAGATFTENGASRVRTLENGNAADLERLRQSTLTALTAADAKGIARADVLLAWSFTTQTTDTTLAELRGKPAEWALPTAITNVVDLSQVNLLATLSSATMKDFSSAVRAGKEGRFVTGNALDLMGTELDLTDPMNPVTVPTEGPFTDATLAAPRQEQLIFTLVLPKTPKHADGRIPLILFQHGITRSRRDALFIANTIAKAGYATLAIDHPLHGDRSFCSVAAECLTGGCMGNRCQPGQYRLSTNFLDAQLGTAGISGLKFSSTTNLAATRDQIRQLIIDTAQLIRVAKDTTAGIGSMNVDDPATVGIVERLDPTELGYIGMSLGSVMGSLVVAANPEITDATLNVGGASPADILTQASVAFLATKKAKLDAYLLAHRGIGTGTQAYDDFFITARWMLDRADAQNFGRNYIDAPLMGYPKKRIFLSWMKDDPWVPNATTQLLINSIDHVTAPMGFKEKQYIDNGNHSFMMDPSSPVMTQAQDDAVGWISNP